MHRAVRPRAVAERIDPILVPRELARGTISVESLRRSWIQVKARLSSGGSDGPGPRERTGSAGARDGLVRSEHALGVTEYRGKCLCGGVRYRLDADVPDAMFLCHCSRCQRESGTLHGATVFFGRGVLKFESGEEELTSFTLPGTRKSRRFCRICGSPMPRIEADGTIALPAGSLDDTTLVTPTAHIHCDSEAAWARAAASAPRLGGWPG